MSNKVKAFSYLRVSGKGQIKGDGFPRQRIAIQKFAKKNKYEIVDEFRDEGVSGVADGFDRAGLSDLMLELKSNGIRTVLVENSSRLARDLMVSEIILADCRKHGIKVLTSDGIDLTVEDNDPTRVLIRQILTAFDQFEKSMIVQKLAGARRRIRKSKGKCEGRKSYGETEADEVLISRLKVLRTVERRTHVDICKILTEEGILTRKGTPFSQPMIARILKAHVIKKSKGALKSSVV